MRSFIVASNLEILRKGFIQTIKEHFGDGHFSEVKSSGDLLQKLLSTKCDLILADFSYVNTEERDLQWAAIVKKHLPTVPVLLFLGDEFSSNIRHKLSESLICLGRCSTVKDLKSSFDMLLRISADNKNEGKAGNQFGSFAKNSSELALVI